MTTTPHDTPAPRKRNLVTAGLVATIVFSIAAVIFYCYSSSRIHPISTVRLAPDLQLDLIAVQTPTAPPVILISPFTPLVRVIPQSLASLRHSKVFQPIRDFCRTHTPDTLDNPTTGNLALHFLIKKTGAPSFNGYARPKAHTLLHNLFEISGRYSNDPLAQEHSYLTTPNMLSSIINPSLKPYLVLTTTLENVSPFLPTITLTFQQIPPRTTDIPSITIPNPYYTPTTPLENPQPYPARITHDGQTITVHNLITGANPLNLDHYSTTTPLALAEASKFHRATAPPSIISLFTSQSTEDDAPNDWITDGVTFSIGQEKIPFVAPRQNLIFNYEEQLKKVIYYQTFTGDLSITTQPVCVSIHMRRDRNFSPDEADTADIPLPRGEGAITTGTIWQPDKPITATIRMAPVEMMRDKYGDRQYLNVQYDPHLPPNGDYRVKDIAPVLTRNDGTTLSLEAYLFAYTTGNFFYDVHRLNPQADTASALNLDDFTTITVGFARRIPFPHTFDFILQPNKPE